MFEKCKNIKYAPIKKIETTLLKVGIPIRNKILRNSKQNLTTD